MKVPSDNIKVHDHPLAVLWFSHDGILHKVSKNAARTPESIRDLYSLIRRAAKGKKVCALFEVSRESISDKETREILRQEIPKTFMAVAFMSSTPLGQLIATLQSVLAPSHIPTKVFKDEDKARDWLKNYIHLC
jgi:hypothetical protein